MVWLPEGEQIFDMITRFDRMYERDRQTDRQTNTARRQRPRLRSIARQKREGQRRDGQCKNVMSSVVRRPRLRSYWNGFTDTIGRCDANTKLTEFI